MPMSCHLNSGKTRPWHSRRESPLAAAPVLAPRGSPSAARIARSRMASEAPRRAVHSFPAVAAGSGEPSSGGGPLGDGLRRNTAFSTFLVGGRPTAAGGLAGHPSRMLAGTAGATAAAPAILGAAAGPVAGQSSPQVPLEIQSSTGNCKAPNMSRNEPLDDCGLRVPALGRSDRP